MLAAGGTWLWGSTRIDWQFELGDMWDAPDVSNVVVVPFVGDDVVVVKAPWGFAPVSGTLEPGEHWCDAAVRELMEEAGAAPAIEPADGPPLHPFGAYLCRSHAAAPYRDHLPWPAYRRVIAWAEVQIVGPPTQPEGGERIDEVRVLDVDAAAALLDAEPPPDAAIYRLAAELRAAYSAAGRPPPAGRWSKR